MNVKKIGLFIAALTPAGLMVYDLFTDNLGAEPVDAMLTITGLWAIRLLLTTLAVTPIRQQLGKNFIAYRRMLGLYAAFYALLHLAIYMVFEHSLDITAIIDDIIKRNFILIGLLAFVLLIPLTITSTKAMMKRLGKRWKTLHKAVYWVMGLALLHFVWIQKSDYTEPLIYTVLFILLLIARKPPRKSLRQGNTP